MVTQMDFMSKKKEKSCLIFSTYYYSLKWKLLIYGICTVFKIKVVYLE